jgi:hypothetical protein
MQLIDETIEKIKFLGCCSGAYRLAHALYSACHHGKFPGPNLLNISSGLDRSNKELVFRLMDITLEPDYSNADQAKARAFIEERFESCISEDGERWECN